jgi:hypothetical protein
MRPAEPSVDGDRRRGRADVEVQAPIPGEPGLEVRGTAFEVKEEIRTKRPLGNSEPRGTQRTRNGDPVEKANKFGPPGSER